MVKTRLGSNRETCAPPDPALSGGPMASTRPRPLSPHLTIWRWGPSMVVSILHRATGIALSIAGLALLTWWLMALSKGPDAYSVFEKAANSWAGLIVLIGLTWSFFQHLLSGIRHLVTDTGAGYELRSNKSSAILTIVGSLLLTLLSWAFVMGLRP